MNRVPDPLIERLVGELRPVRPYARRDGLLLIALVMAPTLIGIELIQGLWRTGLSGDATPFYYLGVGLLLVLGSSATLTVLTMASPRVGNRHDGPLWALAMAATMPLAALVALWRPGQDTHSLDNAFSLHCLSMSMGSSLLFAVALVVWLRRGAPVAPKLAGMLTGVAATALGSAAYDLACNNDTIAHIGLGHAVPVVIGALVGRFLIAPLLRW